MDELPAEIFLNPIWNALRGPHEHLAKVCGDARRYPAHVAPFAALAAATVLALEELRRLLEPDESVWIAAATLPRVPGLTVAESLECVQMVLPRDVPAAASTNDIAELGAADARDMVALTDLAFPGFFRSHTYRMGSYYGIRRRGELIAMGGERLKLRGFTELSAICTHPGFRGQGLAQRIIGHLVHEHRRAGLVSWLHVGAANTRAIELYGKLGFVAARTITLQRLVRGGPEAPA